jgi:hypothetical protein
MLKLSEDDSSLPLEPMDEAFKRPLHAQTSLLTEKSNIGQRIAVDFFDLSSFVPVLDVGQQSSGQAKEKQVLFNLSGHVGPGWLAQ